MLFFCLFFEWQFCIRNYFGSRKSLLLLTFVYYLSVKNSFDNEARTDNSIYPKAWVKWLNRLLCYYLSSLFIDSFRFQNPRLRVAAKRYHPLLIIFSIVLCSR